MRIFRSFLDGLYAVSDLVTSTNTTTNILSSDLEVQHQDPRLVPKDPVQSSIPQPIPPSSPPPWTCIGLVLWTWWWWRRRQGCAGLLSGLLRARTKKLCFDLFVKRKRKKIAAVIVFVCFLTF